MHNEYSAYVALSASSPSKASIGKDFASPGLGLARKAKRASILSRLFSFL